MTVGPLSQPSVCLNSRDCFPVGQTRVRGFTWGSRRRGASQRKSWFPCPPCLSGSLPSLATLSQECPQTGREHTMCQASWEYLGSRSPAPLSPTPALRWQERSGPCVPGGGALPKPGVKERSLLLFFFFFFVRAQVCFLGVCTCLLISSLSRGLFYFYHLVKLIIFLLK